MADFKKLKDGQGNSYNVKDEQARTNLASHTSNTSNPHSVTKAQVGLGNVDNTSDANKPISDAQALVNAAKFDKANVKATPGSTPSDENVLSEKYSEETYAKKDGNYPTMTVGAADNLTPYDESAGDDQDDPFLFQATGTGNGSQADFATGALALMKEKRGNSVVVNQQFNNNLNSFSGADLTISVADNVLTGTLTATTGSAYMGFAKYVDNHKFLFIVDTKQDESGIIKIGPNLSGVAPVDINDTVGAWKTSFCIITAINVDQYAQVNINARDKQIGDKFYIRNLCVIDLTQWFGSNDNIPADLLAHPENWYRYYQGSLAYNAGQIVNANSRYIKCIGRQKWDEVAELGGINSATGENESSDSRLRSKNYVRVIPNIEYYLKGTNAFAYVMFYDSAKNYIGYVTPTNGGNTTITTPSNACYLRFVFDTTYGTIYNNDVTLSIYYEGESGYDQYYPYEVLTNNDTGTEELKSAGSAADYKIPDGEITRKIKTYTFTGSEYFALRAEGTNYDTYVSPSNLLPEYAKVNLLSKIICSNGYYGNSSNNSGVYDGTALGVGADNKTLYLSIPHGANPNTIFASGVVMNYELAEPTTEQGTPFSENLIIDDFGSMEFSGTSGVPQGNLIFYPVDYKAFIDTLYDYTEGTPSDIQLKSDLNTAITAFLTGLTGYDATKKQTLKNNEGTLSWEDDE